MNTTPPSTQGAQQGEVQPVLGICLHLIFLDCHSCTPGIWGNSFSQVGAKLGSVHLKSEVVVVFVYKGWAALPCFTIDQLPSVMWLRKEMAINTASKARAVLRLQLNRSICDFIIKSELPSAPFWLFYRAFDILVHTACFVSKIFNLGGNYPVLAH